MRLIETDLEDNLAPLAAWLDRAGIAHRVFEERGRQVLEVTAADATRAAALVTAWRTGRLPRAEPASDAAAGGRGVRVLRALARYPGLAVLLVPALVLFPYSLAMSYGQVGPLAAALLFLDLPTAFAQPWRLLTPIFLHFSVVHLAFNSAIVIELGRRIEAGAGTGYLLLLVLWMGVVSNVVQSLASGPGLFGGLSGVGYGLLGWLMVMTRRAPDDPRWTLQPGVAASLLLFLVLFSTGITEWFGLAIANAAHWGGLVSGALAALFAPLSKRRS
ncbi:MAG: rhomboid family intramembrane serine protease [Gammaproteobacteria bacterium]